MVMGEELMLMIVLRFRVVMTFGEMAGSLFLGVPGRPAPASVTLEIVTPRSSDFSGTMSGLPN